MKVQFDFTIEDVLDVNRRQKRISSEARRRALVHVFATAFVAMLMAGALTFTFTQIIEAMPKERSISRAALVAGLALLFVPFLDSKISDSEIRRSIERCYGNGPYSFTLEITEAGITYNAYGYTVSCSWTQIESLNELEDSVEIITIPPSLIVVRARAFDSRLLMNDFVLKANEYLRHAKGELQQSSE